MLVPMFFSVLGAHISVVKFQYLYLIWKNHVEFWPFSPHGNGVSIVSKRRLLHVKTAFIAGINGIFGR